MSHSLQSIQRSGENKVGNRLPLERPKLKVLRYLLFAAMLLGMGISTSLGTSRAEGNKMPLASQAYDPAVAYNSANDEHLVVWRDGTSASDIYGQRVSSSGALLGSEFPISTAPESQGLPTVAYNSTSGEYLVAWGDGRSGNADIYGQRVSASGTLLGSEFPISTASGASSQDDPAMAYNSASSEYLILWRDDRQGLPAVIYGQRVSASGALLGSNFPLPVASNTFEQRDPAVAYNSASGEYLVAWADDRANTYDIYGHRVSASGVPVGNDIFISSTNAFHYEPVVAYNSASGEYFVAWQDRVTGEEDIYGQRVSASGALVGSNIIIAAAFRYQSAPTVAYNSASGEYLVAWYDYRNAPHLDIYGQRVSSSGALVGSNFLISSATTNEWEPAMSYNSANGEYLVAWRDERSGNPDIYGQRVSSSGVLVGSNFPITSGTSAATSTPAPSTATPIPPTATPAVTATAVSCTPGQFSDVPPDHTFYQYVSCLVDRGVMSGYSDCTFRPSLNLTRGQLAKVVSNAANFTEPHTTQSFEDVTADHTFYLWIERLASRGIIGGYACGGENEPCVPPQNRPYFRSGNNVTRGQTAKIVAIAASLPTPPQDSWTFQDVPGNHTFWQWIEALSAAGAIGGYGCGGEGEPCVPPNNRPYFRVGNNVTRGQASKIVANTFFPNCQTR